MSYVNYASRKKKKKSTAPPLDVPVILVRLMDHLTPGVAYDLGLNQALFSLVLASVIGSGMDIWPISGQES